MDIKLCLGSSCFARGNSEVLSFVEEYISKNNIEANIDLSGCRCENHCAAGPNIFINGKKYSGLSQEELKKLIDQEAGIK